MKLLHLPRLGIICEDLWASSLKVKMALGTGLVKASLGYCALQVTGRRWRAAGEFFLKNLIFLRKWTELSALSRLSLDECPNQKTTEHT
jgi:hypothetical protein